MIRSVRVAVSSLTAKVTTAAPVKTAQGRCSVILRLIRKIQALVPLCNRFFGITVELLIPRSSADLGPGRLEFEHEMGAFRWRWEFRINSGGMWMNKIWPARIPQPQRAPADATEMTLGLALDWLRVIRISDESLIETNAVPALNLKGVIVSA